MPEQIPEKEKTHRLELVRKLSVDMKLEYRRSFIGKKQRVLVEQFNENGFATGYGEHYVPVLIRKKGLEKNTFYDVRLTGIEMADEPLVLGEL